MNPLSFGESIQLVRAMWGGATFTTATTGTIAVPTGASYLRKIVLSITDEVAQTTAGDILFTLASSTDTLFSEYVYIPATASTQPGEAWHRDIPFDGAVFPVSGNITWTLSAALTAGRGSINLYFC